YGVSRSEAATECEVLQASKPAVHNGLEPWIRFSEGHAASKNFASATMIQEIEFAPDSPLEGDEFELPVPRSETMISAFAKGKRAMENTRGVSSRRSQRHPPLRLSRQPNLELPRRSLPPKVDHFSLSEAGRRLAQLGRHTWTP